MKIKLINGNFVKLSSTQRVVKGVGSIWIEENGSVLYENDDLQRVQDVYEQLIEARRDSRKEVDMSRTFIGEEQSFDIDEYFSPLTEGDFNFNSYFAPLYG